MRTRTANPAARRLGVEQLLGAVEQRPATNPARKSAGSIFSDNLPQYIVEPAGFFQLTVPAAASYPTGVQAWYGLRRIRFGIDLPECQFVGYRMTMLPLDTAGTTIGGVVGSPWGDRRGITAAVIIGKNLPIQESAWSLAQAHVPGIEAGTNPAPAHTLLIGPGNPPKYLAVESFPTGSFADTTPNKITPARTFAPFVDICKSGDTLDVALVTQTGYLPLAGGKLFGMVDIRMVLSPIDGWRTRGTIS